MIDEFDSTERSDFNRAKRTQRSAARSTDEAEGSSLVPGYYDSNLIEVFCNDYTPGSYGNCDTIFTESQLRDIFNAHRDQDMTFTDPWLQYKTELLNRGFSFRPNTELQSSVMYVRIVEPDLLVAL